MVRKVGTDKTQVLHRMRLRQSTPGQPILDVKLTPRESRPDPEVIFMHDDWYAKAWECKSEEPILHSGYNNAVTPNSAEVAVRSDVAVDEKVPF